MRSPLVRLLELTQSLTILIDETVWFCFETPKEFILPKQNLFSACTCESMNTRTNLCIDVYVAQTA